MNYQGRDCVGIATSTHDAWTREALYAECRRRKLNCTKGMTKKTLCQVLNEGIKQQPIKRVESVKVVPIIPPSNQLKRNHMQISLNLR